MKKTETHLSDSDNSALQLIHLSERFEDKRIDVPLEVFDWGIQDCFLIICEFNKKYLIGKLKEDYEFCPDDWDFLTPHAQTEDDWKERALHAPGFYAGLKPTRILRAYHTFMWLDMDSQLWWHFIPFRIGVESERFTLDPKKKYSEFRWVERGEMKEYSRQGYFNDVCRRTLNVDHLYVDDYTTIHDIERGYFSFFPHRK